MQTLIIDEYLAADGTLRVALRESLAKPARYVLTRAEAQELKAEIDRALLLSDDQAETS